jgi:transcriptional regulator with XRE-family HTH domain
MKYNSQKEKPMTFAEKLKQARKEKKMSQGTLAAAAGISLRTLQNYELGKRYPASIEITLRLASALEIPVQSLLSAGEESIVSAPFDARAQLKNLVSAVSGLFAGGQLGEEDRDAAMEAIIAAYWAAKKENRKADRKDPWEQK